MRFVSRAAAGLRPATGATGINPVRGSTVHYAGESLGSFPHSSCAAKVRAQQAFHMDERGWTDLAYNAVVCPHGYVFEGRWIGRRSGANGTNAGNRDWYAIQAMIGVGDPKPAVMVEAIAECAELFRTAGRAGPDVNGHRDHKATACPGDPLYADVQAGTFERAPQPAPPTDPEEDEIMGAKDEILAEIEQTKPLAVRVADTPWPKDDPVNGHRGQVWILSADELPWHVPDRFTLDVLYICGLIRADDGNQPGSIAWEAVEKIRAGIAAR